VCLLLLLLLLVLLTHVCLLLLLLVLLVLLVLLLLLLVLVLLLLVLVCCRESWGTFSYMTQQSHWGWATQQSVRFAGALMMWQIGKRMPKKYDIHGDLRQALYGDINEFLTAIGSRDFMGGSKPNLADLAVYGVLKAIQGTNTYNDVIVNTDIGPWLVRMTIAVGESQEVKQGVAGAAAGAA
jgi:microsomal prostaglandin-E synthase 2